MEEMERKAFEYVKSCRIGKHKYNTKRAAKMASRFHGSWYMDERLYLKGSTKYINFL
tara:strand:+ start:5813 stop:5983 length:171 start_codon:yes stop_codon:yes gene_type:complete